MEDKTYVGNIEFKSDKIVFKDDKSSVNDEPCEIEIPICNIVTEKLKEYIMRKRDCQKIIIETKNDKCEFEFNLHDDYEKFIDMAKKNILP